MLFWFTFSDDKSSYWALVLVKKEQCILHVQKCYFEESTFSNIAGKKIQGNVAQKDKETSTTFEPSNYCITVSTWFR
jgi:hypothetical protein